MCAYVTFDICTPTRFHSRWWKRKISWPTLVLHFRLTSSFTNAEFIILIFFDFHDILRNLNHLIIVCIFIICLNFSTTVIFREFANILWMALTVGRFTATPHHSLLLVLMLLALYTISPIVQFHFAAPDSRIRPRTRTRTRTRNVCLLCRCLCLYCCWNSDICSYVRICRFCGVLSFGIRFSAFPLFSIFFFFFFSVWIAHYWLWLPTWHVKFFSINNLSTFHRYFEWNFYRFRWLHVYTKWLFSFH